MTNPTSTSENEHDASDVFNNLDRLRLTQDFSAEVDVSPVLTSAKVRKPGRQEFVRVREGNDWEFDTRTLTEASTGDTYLVMPEAIPIITEHVRSVKLLLAVGRESAVPFIWPIVLPGPDGIWNSWHESAFAAARLARKSWLRVASDRAAGVYVPHVARGDFGEPKWPEELEMCDYLRLAFKDRIIDSPDHVIVKRLQGEA